MAIILIRTLILFLSLILAMRLMGKRQIGEMEPAEFVVTMLVANLAAIPMQDAGIPLLTGLIPILTVLGVELVLSWLMLCSGPLRRLFCGRSRILRQIFTDMSDPHPIIRLKSLFVPFINKTGFLFLHTGIHHIRFHQTTFIKRKLPAKSRDSVQTTIHSVSYLQFIIDKSR